MAAKYQLITELYQRTGVTVTRNPQAWQGFLSSACRNYKCRFDEQLLIYAQRPDATAVTTIEVWNRLFKRWVNKDSKGIAVFDTKGRRNTLKYYFDVSDTHEGYYGSRAVPIWQMDGRYEQAVMERLSDRFGEVESDGLAGVLMETAKNAVEDNLQDYTVQLKDCTEGSFLEGLDDYNIEVMYRELATNSVAYMLMTRCGIDAAEHFDREDFGAIVNFNTPQTLNAIGIAASDIAEMALREISQTIINVQMAEKAQKRTFARQYQIRYDSGRTQPERSENNERNHLHEAGRLPYTRPHITDRARASAWQVRFDAQGLSGEAQKGGVPQPADIGQAERTPAPDRAGGTFQTGTADEAALQGAGRDGGTERESAHAVGAGDERHPQPGGGNDSGRADLPVESEPAEGGQRSIATEEEVRANLPTVDEQIEMMVEAEDMRNESAPISSASPYLGGGYSQEDIDSILTKGSGFQDSKYRIYRQFLKAADSKSNIDFLKREYGTGSGSYHFSDGRSGHFESGGKGFSIDRELILTWSKAEKRLRELIQNNRYFSPKEKDHYADYLEGVSAPQYEIDSQRKAARQRFIDAHRDLPPADKRDTLPLRNPEFPLFGTEMSRADFEEKLRENPMNDHLKAVITEKQETRTPTEKKETEAPTEGKADSITFSIGFSEHPAFYDRQLNDRYTAPSFALGNKLLGVLDEKQHRERLDKSKGVGWYKKTDFAIQAVIGGEEFNYEGRFDIGDGEGDLIAHIKNFYDYSLSPNCPFIPEWKRQGEDYYREKIENLRFGHDTLLPFLMQNTELTPEDEKLLTEIMATEADWNRKAEDKAQPEETKAVEEIPIEATPAEQTSAEQTPTKGNSAVDEMLAFAERIAAQYETEPPEERFEVIMTSDAFPDPEDAFAIWDNIREEYYADTDGRVLTYPTEETAAAGLLEVRKAVSDKEAGEWLYAERVKQGVIPAPSEPAKQDNSDLIGTEITIDNRRYLIERIGEISGDVSLRDITFQNNVGFPINRVEKIAYVRRLLEQGQKELPPEKGNAEAPIPTTTKLPALAADRNNYRITDDALGVNAARANAGFSPKEKFRNNMAAVNLLHELEIESRLATPEEQETLAKYVGWGGLSMAFDSNNAAWTNEYKELKTVLSDEEYRAAMESTLTAFYTPPVVIKAMYEALDRLGFSKGNILEPSCGVGNFLGLLPDSMADSRLYGVEIDPLSGKIARQLYQRASIAIEGFEDTKLPDSHFDVVLGNVPFGEFKVDDSRYNAQKFLIHDYFFAKALDKVRTGGVVMFITSKGTMDKASPEVRRYIAQRAELLGAIRLPDNTFRANAGTEVTSDILILQKRDRIIDTEPDWIYLDTDKNGITQNHYFVQHPEMVLGTMQMESTRFGMDTACKADKERPLSELLQEAVGRISGEIPEYESEIDQISDEQDKSIPADPNVRNFSYALVDGKIYFRENDRMTPASASMTAENRIKGLLGIRDSVRSLIEYQTNDYPEEMIKTEQENLNRLYDAFTQKYGLINSRGNYLAFAADESYFLLCSLEVLDDEGKFKRKADMFTKRTIKPHREVTSVETASEALALSIGEKARVDLGYMAQLTGRTQEEIVTELQGVIFRVPNTEPARYAAADEYLSGNVREKLKVAEIAAKSDPALSLNVEALRQVIPKDLSAAEIAVRLGTTWIPESDIQQFVMELLTPSSHAAGRLKVRYTPYNGDWFIENKTSDFGNVKADSTYGTKRASAYRIIEDTLNLKDTRIFDYVHDEHGNKKAVFNAKETTAAQAKQEVIKQAFGDWIWKDPERRNRLVRYYNDTFNSVRPREYDGRHITFGGISPEIKLRPHQVNAIAHILYGGNTLLAHKVGAGKTFEMVAAAQESKRLGLCQKSMFVVPNHLVGQWASEYLRLYPSANILVTTKQDFETANRKKFCGRIATGDYDAVIIGHSQFEKIQMSEERQREQLQRQLDDIEMGIDEIQKSHGEQFTVKQLMKTRKAIEAKLKKLNDTKRKDTVIDFEQLGVDRLFIDESHFYKNLYLYTKMRNVGGIAQTEAQKSSDLFMKCRYLDEITGNRGTVFATGTPISNSMVEMYSVQRYLQYDTLARNGLQHFDAWASTFGETVTALELAPEGYTFSRR